MLPAGTFLRRLSEYAVSEDGDSINMLFELFNGGIASIVFPVAELEQRAVVVQDSDVGFPSMLH